MREVTEGSKFPRSRLRMVPEANGLQHSKKTFGANAISWEFQLALNLPFPNLPYSGWRSILQTLTPSHDYPILLY